MALSPSQSQDYANDFCAIVMMTPILNNQLAEPVTENHADGSHCHCVTGELGC
jgi:hypothetical protein